MDLATSGSRVSSFPDAALSRLKIQMPEIASQMEAAILAEVPRYAAAPDVYREAVLQRCRLATRLFLRILATGEPAAARDVRVVQSIARNLARFGEPLEPLLHALRIGARVGWDETLRVSLVDAAISPESMLPLAGQVFEYIDQLSSRVAEAYAQQIEQSTRVQLISESALFEDLITGRASGDRLDALGVDRPHVALALAAGDADPGTAQGAAETTAGRLRTRFPSAVVGQRHGMSVWLMAREPLMAALADCAGSRNVVFGMSFTSDEIPLGRAVEEAVVAARVGLDLGLETGSPRVFDLPRLYPYAALRSDPEGLTRSQAALLGPLLGHPTLLQTLRAYFDTNRSVSATAARVHRHRQSVIYRLRRAAKLLDIDFDSAETMFRVEAAVRTLPIDRGSD